ncbi:LLM class flavin-dependent oxidoreductase [soil metagenome]
MRFSVWPNPAQPWESVLECARHAEATGWDGVWFADHFMTNTGTREPADGPMLECWAVLAGLAAAVPRVRLGSLVCGNTYRHPAVLAKQAAAVDTISGGRLVLGLGAGWQENEHRAYGIEFPAVGERMDRLEEACQVVLGLLREPRTTVAGRHYQVTDAPADPKPVSSPLPLLIGGGGEKRTMRIAARYADEWNVWGTPEVLRQKGGVLERHCADLDRDPAAIARSAQALLFLSEDESWLSKRRDSDVGRASIVGTPDEVAEIVAAYAEAGVDELILPDFTMGDPQRRADTYDLFKERVMPQVS